VAGLGVSPVRSWRGPGHQVLPVPASPTCPRRRFAELSGFRVAPILAEPSARPVSASRRFRLPGFRLAAVSVADPRRFRASRASPSPRRPASASRRCADPRRFRGCPRLAEPSASRRCLPRRSLAIRSRRRRAAPVRVSAWPWSPGLPVPALPSCRASPSCPVPASPSCPRRRFPMRPRRAAVWPCRAVRASDPLRFRVRRRRAVRASGLPRLGVALVSAVPIYRASPGYPAFPGSAYKSGHDSDYQITHIAVPAITISGYHRIQLSRYHAGIDRG
jgi:hypothetical protein